MPTSMPRIVPWLVAALLGLPGLAHADSLVATDQVVTTSGGGGGGAISMIRQSGSANTGIVDQRGGNVSLTQSGASNYALINTIGTNVTATQSGGASVTVTGNGPSVTITQSRPR